MTRCERLMATLKERGIEAALIHCPENIRYLTGFTGEGCAFICADEAVVVTDFRYVEQAERQAPGLRVISTDAEHPEWSRVRELTDERAVKVLAVESNFLSYDEHEKLRKQLPFVELAGMDGIPEKLREIKDAGEIESIIRASEIACRAFMNILDRIHAGMTERQVQIMLDFEMLSLGSEENAFPTIAAAGANGSLCHAIPSDYIIQSGDLLTLDFGAKIDGYCSDMTRTVALGKVSPELRAIYDLVYDAHMAALEAVRPGAACRDVDAIARNMIDARYPGAFGHGLGHCVGLQIHEDPRFAPGSKAVLQPGHVITVEPGVYIPGLGGCRIEDTVVVTEDGHLDPVTAPKQFIEL